MTTGPSRRAAAIAIGAAIVALLTSVIAVIVVANRGGGERPGAVVERGTKDEAAPVPAVEVVKLGADAVEIVRESGVVLGVKVIDDKLREKLRLAAGDVITSISGRAVKRELDVYEAIVGLSMIDSKELFVEVMRDEQPVLVRWRIEGDLRLARRTPDRDPVRDPRDPWAPRPPIGILGGTPGTVPSDPADAALLATIKKVDELVFDVPRKTADQLMSDRTKLMRGARVVPAMRNGKVDGIKLYAIRPYSPYAALGFQNGDTVVSVNGFEITSIAGAVDLFDQLKDSKELRFEIVRRGKPRELTLKII